MTAAQVVAAGEYLESDFDPASLTVNQLLGVFGYHNINFPAPYTKPKLVQLFNDEIKTNAVKLKKERARKDSSIPSDNGITDGVTGRPLTEKVRERSAWVDMRRSDNTLILGSTCSKVFQATISRSHGGGTGRTASTT